MKAWRAMKEDLRGRGAWRPAMPGSEYREATITREPHVHPAFSCSSLHDIRRPPPMAADARPRVHNADLHDLHHFMVNAL
jgi:hypothetical protein